MVKKYYLSNVNQCQKLDDGYSKILKIDADGDKHAFGKLNVGWDSSGLSFVSYVDVQGKEHSIPSSNIEHITHGYSKWSLHFHPKARMEGAELGKLKGYVCVDSNEDIEFYTSTQEETESWDFQSKNRLLVLL
ncbi:hypothetical protein [Marinobacter alexandrii]|jgi:hypothetical protein|uniref:hypothetical protein n=1 Tax=Marinobacter alexandrii TaxID=2570351 RepID=UPI002ABE4714|nr:hypothetical protein [Marinobacter alexandrii]